MKIKLNYIIPIISYLYDIILLDDEIVIAFYNTANLRLVSSTLNCSGVTFARINSHSQRRKHTATSILNVQMYSHGYEYPLRKGNLNIAKHSLDLSHTDFAREYSNSTSRGGGDGGERGFIVTRFQIALDLTRTEMRTCGRE